MLGIIGTTAELHAISSLGQALPTASNHSRGVESIDQYGGDEPSVLTAVVPQIRARNLQS